MTKIAGSGSRDMDLRIQIRIRIHTKCHESAKLILSKAIPVLQKTRPKEKKNAIPSQRLLMTTNGD
jgi:hypothetical protein